VQQARADLATVDANLSLAKITADRQQRLLNANATPKLNVDQAVSNLAALQATYNSNAANVQRLEDMQSFQKIYAPFAGVVTARNTDVGALISAGTANVAAKELFHVSAIETLRVYVAVPEIFSRAARPGATASLTLEEFPGRLFHGTLVRNANAIDPASRTLLAEVDVDNPDGQLLLGAYVRVRLELSNESPSVTIPANALLFRREGLRVGVVRNDTAELVPVTIGRDYGSTVEIVSGLQSTDAVIVDPSDSLISGTPVQTKTGSTGQ
jgi:RND family efflux transporter MFP subunit